MRACEHHLLEAWCDKYVRPSKSYRADRNKKKEKKKEIWNISIYISLYKDYKPEVLSHNPCS